MSPEEVCKVDQMVKDDIKINNKVKKILPKKTKKKTTNKQ